MIDQGPRQERLRPQGGVPQRAQEEQEEEQEVSCSHNMAKQYYWHHTKTKLHWRKNESAKIIPWKRVVNRSFRAKLLQWAAE